MSGGNESLWPISSHIACIPGEGCRNHPGLTIRDWFAGQALAEMARQIEAHYDNLSGAEFAATVANGAYAIADAMLAQREAK